MTAIVSWIKSNTTIFKRYNYVRVEPTDTDGYFGTSSFDIIWNLSSVNYGWLMLRSDNSKSVLFGRLVSGEAKWDIPVFNSDLVQYFESGSAIISQIPAGSSGAKTILFSTTKVSTPHVVLTTRESTPDKFALQVHSITKNGFSVVAVNNKTSVSDCNFEWIAVCN